MLDLLVDGFPNATWDGRLVYERKYFELRFEAFNACNRPVLAAPNVTASNAAFGAITGVVNKPRSVQLGGRLVF